MDSFFFFFFAGPKIISKRCRGLADKMQVYLFAKEISFPCIFVPERSCHKGVFAESDSVQGRMGQKQIRLLVPNPKNQHPFFLKGGSKKNLASPILAPRETRNDKGGETPQSITDGAANSEAVPTIFL